MGQSRRHGADAGVVGLLAKLGDRPADVPESGTAAATSKTAVTIDTERSIWLSHAILPHEAALRRWLRSMLPAGLEADDVVQETYALLASLASVADIREPKPYMFAVARSLILRHLRAARIAPIISVAELSDLSIPDQEASPERRAYAMQELRRVALHLAALPTRCREVFLLRKVEGMPQSAIAARLGISESTVEKHVGKALRILMGCMASGEPAAATERKGDDDERAPARQRH